MFSGPYNEAMQVAMGETSLGNSKLNIMSTVGGFPDYFMAAMNVSLSAQSAV